jgi:TonB family protein
LVRADSPFVLALASTLAIHVVLAIAADALVLTMPKDKHEIAPVVKFVKIDPPKKKPPPPAEPKKIEPPPEAAKPMPAPTPQPKRTERAVRQQASRPPDPTLPPPPPNTPTEPGGGEPTMQMDLGQNMVGDVAVKRGPPTHGTGRGGHGGGTSTGTGEGSGSATKPVSVATIKIAARPKGDYDLVSLGKDYPAEAKQLGVEGDIRVKLTVDETGKVTAALLLNRLGHGLDEVALDHARKITFDPARDTSDRAVASVVVWTFHMTLPKT